MNHINQLHVFYVISVGLREEVSLHFSFVFIFWTQIVFDIIVIGDSRPKNAVPVPLKVEKSSILIIKYFGKCPKIKANLIVIRLWLGYHSMQMNTFCL